MKIYCTVKEFGQIVRACEKGQCYNCALRDVCRADEMEQKTIEDFITAETIEKEADEDEETDHDRDGIQSDYEDMFPWG